MMALVSEQDPLIGDSEFFQKTLDCLLLHVAILNEDGVIIAVNAPWSQFATSNGLSARSCGPGANYLGSCDRASGPCSEEAKTVAEGIRSVMTKKREHFYLEYPCHSPIEQRWFSVRFTRFEIGSAVRVVVAHENITQRKLAELKVQETNRVLALLAGTDGLTGIANRRRFDLVIEREWKRHQRQQTPLSVALVDVDWFKQFNDVYGHQAGDECLRRIAETLDTIACRAGDFVARYGGEEFAIIFPNTSAGAAVVLEEVLRAIRALAIPQRSSGSARGIVTVSIGCATVTPGETDREADLLSRADQALYEAKAKGRNQMVCAEVDLSACSTRYEGDD